jgi:predicted RecB family nuclease
MIDFSPLTILIILGGIAIGWILSYLKSLLTIRKYKKELAEYKAHLERQMKITDTGSKKMMEEMDLLKKDNENLRISVKTLGQKPGRAELRQFNIYDNALRKMMLQAPGFSSAWESSLQESEREYEENEAGFKNIIGKVFGTGGLNSSENGTQTHQIEHKN